ncbi:MAG TPA: YitT family protein [Burkholderiaceae bacterium]|nr:YitT family protein [Burkholderiaceae bacterium]
MKQHLINWAYCTVGALLLASGVVFFLAPNHVAAGGPPGIAIILSHTLGFNKGLVVFGLNSVLMAFGLRQLGAQFLIRTGYAVIAQAAFIELLNQLLPMRAITSTPFLTAIYGGIFVGAGLALMFKGEAASGGYTLVARMIASRLRVGVGQVLLFFDICVIVASGLAFGTIEAALWAGIGVYVATSVVDLMLRGERSSKVVHITTRRAKELAQLFEEQLPDDGSTVHCNTLNDAIGQVLMVIVVDRGKVNKLLDIVRGSDAQAHVVVIDASDFIVGSSIKEVVA